MDENNQFYTDLFICSGLMKTHYKYYGDIIIMDSTYRVNKYKLPLSILSGFTHTGRICIFRIGILNNETKETFDWLLKEFFKIHAKLPVILVSDHDLALESVLDNNYPMIKHIICSWHVDQSFNKNFAYLSAMNLLSLKQNLNKLCTCESKSEFERIYEEAKALFLSRKLNKSYNYLEKMYNCKDKWSRCYFSNIFTGGIHTTSRAESVNSLIKRYVGSNCEISDFIRFLKHIEKKFVDQEYKDSDDSEQKQIHPLILLFRKQLSEVIFRKHYEQYYL